VQKTTGHSLRNLSNAKQTTTQTERIQEPEAILPYKRFATRIGHKQGGHTKAERDAYNAEATAIKNDPAIRLYLADLSQSRNNNGILNDEAIQSTITATRQFLRYTDTPITDHAMQDLVTYKRHNRDSTDIELAVKSYALEAPIQSHANRACRIQGIFTRNFAKLDVKVNTHFPPAIENITRGIFREIFTHLTTEQQDMIQ
jgi:hypothetical protein